ncbi:uncharacterized protein LOC122507255 [Leptopilina heterotoma]|uniref:uncharacterized protein LOC122507255 n=1 Tax=Leptopilina heterotoma TaxID=63436 RepID=UPI001CA9F1DD|nr:uncharacterized protein LOC122507255 [Leptopilina heterotoma]
MNRKYFKYLQPNSMDPIPASTKYRSLKRRKQEESDDVCQKEKATEDNNDIQDFNIRQKRKITEDNNDLQVFETQVIMDSEIKIFEDNGINNAENSTLQDNNEELLVNFSKNEESQITSEITREKIEAIMTELNDEIDNSAQYSSEYSEIFLICGRPHEKGPLCRF